MQGAIFGGNVFQRSSRRRFLKGAVAVGAVESIGREALLQQGFAQPANPRVIDCHHHFLSPAYIKALASHDGKKMTGYSTWFSLDRLKNYTPQQDLESMDHDGVATSLLSCTTPGIWFGDPDESAMLAREMNEFGARLVNDHKGRFGLFALLPLPSVDESLKEIAYAFDTLKADGVGLVSSYGNHWLGDPIFKPIFAELNRRRAVVYVHPIDAPCCQELMANVPPTVLEYNHDTARTIYSLLVTGAATRYNDIQFIFSHGGGTMPGLVERFQIGGPENINDNLAGTPEPNSRLFHLRRFYYDTAGSVNIVQMTSLKMVAGASRIVFGTDYPFATAGQHLTGLQTCGFNQAELQGIYRGNATKFLPKYA